MHAASGSLLAATVLAASAAASPGAGPGAGAESLPFFMGTDAEGVYASALDTKTGALSQPRLVAEMEKPGFLWVHPQRPVLYAVGGRGAASELAAFEIGEEQRLTRLGSVGTGGRGACFVTVSPGGGLAAVAHYGSGSVALFPLAEDGTPGQPRVVAHKGGSVHPERQTEPHAHSVRFTGDGRRLLAADLGTDQLLVYDVDVMEGGGLELAEPPAIDLPPGSGPRHFVFTPGRGEVLVLNELAGTVSVAPVEPVTGSVTATVSAVAADLPADAQRASAEILFHPGGRFVYASNRGPGEVAWFAWEGSSLERRGAVPSGGDWPRNFRLTGDGRFLLVANQRSGGVVSFRIDAATGEPVATGHRVEVPGPTCLKFAP